MDGNGVTGLGGFGGSLNGAKGPRAVAGAGIVARWRDVEFGGQSASGRKEQKEWGEQGVFHT
jgi:hypothetical protein